MIDKKDDVSSLRDIPSLASLHIAALSSNDLDLLFAMLVITPSSDIQQSPSRPLQRDGLI